MNSAVPGGGDPEEILRQSWAANADAWTQVVRGGGIPSRRAGTDHAIVEAVLRHPAGRVLDVGCGEGWLARELAARGYDVLGIDGSEELVRHAAATGGARYRTLAYHQAVRDPAVLGGPFDLAVCNFSLLGEQLAPTLRAFAAALAPGGRILIQTIHPWAACGDEPYRDGWCTETFDNFSADFVCPMPWFFRTMGSWLRELGSAGLQLEELNEPLDPSTGRPLSLLLTARPG